MYISLNWIRQYVDLPENKTAEDIAHDLTMHVVEIESIKSTHELAKGIVIGQIIAVGEHPNADKLKLVTVDDGTAKNKTIVCGGTNLREGQLVALALPGAQARWHGEGEPITIEEAEVRGEKSYGMICAAEEIDIDHPATKDDGERPILDLEELGIKEEDIGTTLYAALEAQGIPDTVLEVDNKSMTHRADLWGHYGIARELAALYSTTITPLAEIAPPTRETMADTDTGEGNSKDAVQIKASIQKESKAKAVNFVLLEGVTNQQSKPYIQQHLQAVGVTPRNAIVDCTNYVMLELGQPTHAYDAATIDASSITVENANADESFHALDDTTHDLTNNDVVIRDGKGISIGLAGVIGGHASQITDATTSVVLESGCFDPVRTRRTAKRHNLKTDAAMRFEKAPDAIEQPAYGLRRLVALLQEHFPGAVLQTGVASAHMDGYKDWSSATVQTSTAWLQERIGKAIPEDEIIDILERLQFTVEADKGNLTISAPIHRTPKDISIPEDIVEEVARIHGYDNIEPQLPAVAITPPARNQEREREWAIRDILAARGCTEVLNYAFVGDKDLESTGEKKEDHIAMENSLSSHQTMLRRSMVAGMISVITKNIRKHEAPRIFEIGRTYDKHSEGAYATTSNDTRLPAEETRLAIAVVDEAGDRTVQQETENILNRLNIPYVLQQQQKEHEPWMHTAKTGQLIVEGEVVGVVTQLHPRIAQTVAKGIVVGYAELYLSRLAALPDMGQHVPKHKEQSKYPVASFDFSFTVPKKTLWANLKETLMFANDAVQHLEVFDVYEGKGVEKDAKRIAFHIQAGASDHTLDESEVEAIRNDLIAAAKKSHGAVLEGE